MGELIVYSFKIEQEQLKRAKKFFARQGALLQDSLRDLIGAAADCEHCLELQEEDVPISELQSAFATLLAHCKKTWHLNGLLQEAVLEIAKMCKVPLDFIMNVLGEARKPAAERVRRV